jgi:2,3-bisphosphoglycerate-dependent phosphoglycerate mutase
MTKIYFVRHAQPVHDWKENSTRPLTKEGVEDSKKVTEVLEKIDFDYCVCSPYIRSVDTIKECAEKHYLDIRLDNRLRERQSNNGGSKEEIENRWSDFDYHEEGGESLRMVQYRNIECLMEILRENEDETILIGTHGTALSTIINYFDENFGFNDFWRILDITPYIIYLEFKKDKCIVKKELLIVKKEFKDKFIQTKIKSNSE